MPETLVAQRTQKTKVVGVTIRLEKIQFTETKTMTLFQLKDARKNGILSETWNWAAFFLAFDTSTMAYKWPKLTSPHLEDFNGTLFLFVYIPSHAT